VKPDSEQPEPPKDKRDLAGQVQYLAAVLRVTFKLSLVPDELAEITRLVGRVGPENYEDVIAAILLECLQVKQSGGPVSGTFVVRVADRIRQRISRASQRLRPLASPEFAAADALPPEEEVGLVAHEFQVLLKRRSPQEALLFQRYYLDGERNLDHLSEEFQVSRATLYRWLKAIKDDFFSLREMRDPPSGAD
jgi:DNA-directed RNA polymerase specialized sigma24 family protein